MLYHKRFAKIMYHSIKSIRKHALKELTVFCIILAHKVNIVPEFISLD